MLYQGQSPKQPLLLDHSGTVMSGMVPFYLLQHALFFDSYIEMNNYKTNNNNKIRIITVIQKVIMIILKNNTYLNVYIVINLIK